MLAHSATIKSGATSRAFCRNASAKFVPSSSTTHLIRMPASITSVFNALFALRAEEPRKAFAAIFWLAYEGRQPIDQRMVQPRLPGTGEESPDARPRRSAHGVQ